MNLQKIELHTAEGAIIEYYLDFQEAVHEAYYSDEHLQSRNWRRQHVRVPPGNRTLVDILAVKDELIIGHGYFSYSNREVDTNPEFAAIFITTHPKFTHQGIAKAIFKKLLDIAKEYNKSIVETWVRSSSTIALQWVERLPFKLTQIERENRLKVENINHKFMNDTLPVLQQKLSQYSVMTVNKEKYLQLLTDDAFAKQLADFYTEADNLVPRGDSQRANVVITVEDLRKRMESLQQSKYELYYVYLLDGAKIIAESGSGYAVDDEVYEAETHLTAVRTAYQRQGIATYLKILVTKFYIDTFPNLRYIATGNADTNEGMLAINTKLGYTQAYLWHTFEGKVEELTHAI